MNAKTLTKQYTKLTQRERAVLSINAWGRKDESEAFRLIDAAPRVNLDAPDCGRVFQRLAFAIDWHALKQAENAANLFLLASLADADADRDTPKYPDSDDTVRVITYNIITRADGWKIFCGELGLDPVGALRIASADPMLMDMVEKIARAVKPDLDVLRASLHATFKEAAAEPKTTEEIAAEYRALLNAGKK